MEQSIRSAGHKMKRHAPSLPKVETQDWIEPTARAGFAAKAFLYTLLGVLLLMSALGVGGQITGIKGAIQYIEGLPAGTALLALIALGLFAYAAFRILQGAVDFDEEGSDAKGILKRIGYVIVGLLHLSFGIYAAKELFASPSQGQGAVQSITGQLMQQPFGPWLVGIFGVVLIAIAAGHAVYALTEKYREKMKEGQMTRKEKVTMNRTAKIGLFARGAVAAIIGVMVFQAALSHNPSQASGTEGALQTLADTPWLLGIMAIGLICYGIYQAFYVKYRQIGYAAYNKQ